MQTFPPYPQTPHPATPGPHLFGVVAAFALSVGLIVASAVVAGAWTRVAETQVVAVTGTAHRNVRSDLAIWHASFSAEADGVLEAHKRLSTDLGKVIAFLQSSGVRDYTVFPVQIREITTHSDNNPESVPVTIGYRLSRNIEVRSNDVDMLARLSSESTDLLQQGVVFAAQSVSFLYTKSAEAKVEMMAEATKDARARADQIAVQGGRKIRHLRAAKAGVTQITPQYSAPSTEEETNDLSSADKTITATVMATFDLR